MNVKIHGLQRTGTNALAVMLKKNFPQITVLDDNHPSWKHGLPVVRPCDSYVMCIRHPITWLVAMHRCQQHMGKAYKGYDPKFHQMSFTEFLASPHYDWSTPIDRWNEMNTIWLDVLQPRLMVVELEELRVRPASVITHFSDRFNERTLMSLPIVESRTVGPGQTMPNPDHREWWEDSYDTPAEYIPYLSHQWSKVNHYLAAQFNYFPRYDV